MLGGSPGRLQKRSVPHGYTVTVNERMPAQAQQRWSGGDMGVGAGRGAAMAGKSTKAFPHMSDLLARAEPNIDINIPV